MADTTPASDEELVARCQAGDYAAFEELYRRHHRPIMAYVHQIVRDYDGTASIAQEVFMKVFEHLDRFDTSRRFTTWFYTIARNTALDWLQARRRHHHVPLSGDDGEPLVDLPAPGQGPEAIEAALARSESTEVLARAIAALPQVHREIIELVAFQGLTYGEAGEILGGVSEGTLRSRMHHALRHLRLALESIAGPDGRNLL